MIKRKKIQEIVNTSIFPKNRPALPKQYREVYAEYYKKNREGGSYASSLSQRMETWLHNKVAGDPRIPRGGSTILEIGAGTLNHVTYEKYYTEYDIVEPFDKLYANSVNIDKVDKRYFGIGCVPLNKKYNRIIAIASFEHILDLPDVIKKCTELLTEHGVLQVAIPNEGSLIWRIGWMLTTGIEFRLRYGLNYRIIMRHEHVNSAEEIYSLLKDKFNDIKIEYFGLNRFFSLYHYISCKR